MYGDTDVLNKSCEVCV